MRGAWLGLVLLAACDGPRSGALSVPAPDRLVRALDRITELEAWAELVPAGGAPGPRIQLQRGDDGVSFSGFIAAEPGSYTLEIAFTGLANGRAARLFLGRLRSDSFTVSRGATASSNFRQPLDPIGRADDGGDLDGDGLGNLDELLLGSDPETGDSDGDGVPDGEDCVAADASRTYRIAAGGSFLDCDADGFSSDDPPFGAPGPDCEDENPDVSPGAVDRCEDTIDSDCDPATCPSNDVEPPELGALMPAAGAELGCFGAVHFRATDASGVAGGSAVFPDDPNPDGSTRVIRIWNVAGDQWQTAPMADAAVLGSFASGPKRLRIEATDGQGNKGTIEHPIELVLELPELVSMTPAVLGNVTQPIDLSITAHASRPISKLQLFLVPRASDGMYPRSGERMIGETSGGQLTVRLDPAELAAGAYLVYPRVEDQIGNVLGPYPSAPLAPFEDTVAADTRCHGNQSLPVPVRSFSIGDSPFRPVKMRDLLTTSLDAARAVDPAAQLTQIVGLGLRADGTIPLDDTRSYTYRWDFGFYNATTRRWVGVLWLTPAFMSASPIVDPDAGNVSSTDPIGDPLGLFDSDRVAALFAQQASCPALTGAEDDQIIYTRADGRDVVLVGAQGKFWRGSAQEPAGTDFTCQ